MERMKNGRRSALINAAVCSLVLVAGRVNGQDPLSLDAEKAEGVERATWRMEFANDCFFKKDNQVSNGWSLQKHSAVAADWATMEDVPEFVKYLGKKIPTLTKEGLVYRTAIAIDQVFQTPDDGSRLDLIKNDVPYVGALTVQASWSAFNDNEFRGLEITAGVVGPGSFAEQTQDAVHTLIGQNKSKGWDNQIENEPVFNLNYMRKYKIWRWGAPEGISFDSAVNGNIDLGNMFTQASVGLEMRLGHNMPGGFVSVPDLLGGSMHSMPALKPAKPDVASLYASLVLNGSAVAHNIFLDGNTFRKSHSVDKEPLVGVAVAGLHYERNNWGIHCRVMATTDVVDTSKAPAAEGRESLGLITLEWRF